MIVAVTPVATVNTPDELPPLIVSPPVTGPTIAAGTVVLVNASGPPVKMIVCGVAKSARLVEDDRIGSRLGEVGGIDVRVHVGPADGGCDRADVERVGRASRPGTTSSPRRLRYRRSVPAFKPARPAKCPALVDDPGRPRRRSWPRPRRWPGCPAQSASDWVMPPLGCRAGCEAGVGDADQVAGVAA